MDGVDVVVPPKFALTADAAMRALAEAVTPNDLMRIADTAEALRVYARRARLGLLAQNRAAEIRLRAERRIGEFLAQTDRHLGGRPNVKPVPEENGFPPARLRELGITRKLSSRAQRLFEISTSDFDSWLQAAQEREIEITTRDLINFFERRQAAEMNRQRLVGGRVDDLKEFAAAGNRMGTLYLDPAWPFDGTVLPYEPVEMEDLCDLPIPALAADRCHIHMWVTGINHQFAAKQIIERWGFRIVGEFVWVKPSLGGRNYWRQSHETMLTAVRIGTDDRFDDHSLRSWIEASRGRHSEKPEEVRLMIERASPGPRLELFARKLIPGWYCWGHEVAVPLRSQEAVTYYVESAL